MIKFTPALALAAVASITLSPAVFAEESSGAEPTEQAAAPVEIGKGDRLYSEDGKRIGSVYSVTESGQPQVIIGSRLVTVPAESLGEKDGKLTTSYSKRELERLR